MLYLRRNEFQIVICGDGGIGKTTLLKTFKRGHFINQTDPLESEQHVIDLNLNLGLNKKTKIFLHFWDLDIDPKDLFQSREQKTSISDFAQHWLQADVIVLCFDLSDLDTLEDIQEWIDFLPAKTPRVLIGTKKDIGDSMKDLIEPHMDALNLQDYIETSARNDMDSIVAFFTEKLFLI
ncbi:MAG: hypothetical protein ACFFBD_17550, partial [Candidatus Hodarchaeota archaeon]